MTSAARSSHGGRMRNRLKSLCRGTRRSRAGTMTSGTGSTSSEPRTNACFNCTSADRFRIWIDVQRFGINAYRIGFDRGRGSSLGRTSRLHRHAQVRKIQRYPIPFEHGFDSRGLEQSGLVRLLAVSPSCSGIARNLAAVASSNSNARCNTPSSTARTLNGNAKPTLSIASVPRAPTDTEGPLRT